MCDWTYAGAEAVLRLRAAVQDGSHSASLPLLGQYMAGNFALASDSHGGTIVNDPPLFGPIAPSLDPGTPAVSDRPTSGPPPRPSIS